MKIRSLARIEWPLLLAIFLDLAGFGMLLPDVQTRLEGFGASGLLIGIAFAGYFMVQILVSPLWGRLSDHLGRKPVFLICSGISAGSMLIYAFAHGIPIILLSRLLAGLGGGNVVVAQAYLADTTDSETRAAAMGRIGAATTSGLILGPAVGGWLATQGGNALVGTVAASASALGVLWVAWRLPSLMPQTGESAETPKDRFAFHLLRDVAALRPLFLLAAVAYFALACLEGTYGRLIHRKLGYGPAQFGLIFGYEALLSVVVQGIILPRLSARFPSRLRLALAYVLQGIGLAFMPFMPNLTGLFAASTLYAIGAGVAGPTLNALCSAVTPEPRQGEMFGMLQAARSFGFLLGPLLGGVLFDWHPEAPYLLAGSVALGVALIAMRIVTEPMETARAQNDISA